MAGYIVGELAVYALQPVRVIEISNDEARGLFRYKVVGLDAPVCPPLGFAWVGYHQLVPMCFYPGALDYYRDRGDIS